MSVYNNLKEDNIIIENSDGSVSINYNELHKTTRESEQKALNTQKEMENQTYTTYNIIAIFSFVFILIITFIVAFKIGKKQKSKGD